MSGRLGSTFDLTDVVALPLWAAAVIGAFLVVVCMLACVRGGPDGRGSTVARVAMVLIAALVGSLTIDYLARRDVGDRRVLEARAHELAARALAPGGALACLDAIAGEAVETACEKALFASPEATASAVAYVAARLALLAAGAEHARRVDPSYETVLTSLRRAVELDRFGIVAHVLAARDGCTPDQCAAFALLKDTSRVRANMAGRTYTAYVSRRAEDWSAPAPGAVAAQTPPAVAEAPQAAPVAGARLPNSVFLPSSSSIPAVSIMSSEPAASDTTGSSPSGTPTPARRPAQARPPTNNAAARPGTPTPLAPGGQ
jgi:hypothetical protein